MDFTYNPKTKRGKVRLLATDTDKDNPYLSDEEIDVFIELEDQDIKGAAARALETIASSETLIQKVISGRDLNTNGPAVAKDLRNAAAQLRKESDDEAVFFIVEHEDNAFSRREKRIKDEMRRV